MINWSCIIQGQHRLSINCSVAASSSLTGECKCAAGAGAAGPAAAAPPCLLPCPKTTPALPPAHLRVILISQRCIHHCLMAFWDPTHIVITTNTTLRSIYSVFFHMQTQENGFGTERGRGTVWSIVSIRWPGASNFQSASVFPST